MNQLIVKLLLNFPDGLVRCLFELVEMVNPVHQQIMKLQSDNLRPVHKQLEKSLSEQEFAYLIPDLRRK